MGDAEELTLDMESKITATVSESRRGYLVTERRSVEVVKSHMTSRDSARGLLLFLLLGEACTAVGIVSFSGALSEALVLEFFELVLSAFLLPSAFPRLAVSVHRRFFFITNEGKWYYWLKDDRQPPTENDLLHFWKGSGWRGSPPFYLPKEVRDAIGVVKPELLLITSE